MIFDFNSQRHFDWLFTYSTNTDFHKNSSCMYLATRFQHTQFYSILDRKATRFNDIKCATSKIHYHLVICNFRIKW